MKKKDLESIIGELLSEKNLTIATAESCTGGLIANRLTNVSGSSRYFERGVISYSNESKIELLNVPIKVIETSGAVSEPTARAMAIGIKELSKTDLGLGVTGIAGPTGGSADKPVGLVYIGFATDDGVEVQKFNFSGNRIEIKQQTADASLDMILNWLKVNH